MILRKKIFFSKDYELQWSLIVDDLGSESGGIVMEFEKWTDRRIWRAIWPICLSFIPIGMAFGVLARKLGFSSLEVAAFSIIVFAGSAQFIGISMIAGGFSLISVVLTTFVVNLRHFLFSSTLAPYFKEAPRSLIPFFTYGLTDESFAVNIREFERGDWSHGQAMRVNVLTWATWLASTLSGAVLGEWVTIDLAVVGYALTAMFIGLWSFYLHHGPFIIVGILSGIIAISLAPFVGFKLYVVAGAIIAATLGCIWECRQKGGAADDESF